MGRLKPKVSISDGEKEKKSVGSKKMVLEISYTPKYIELDRDSFSDALLEAVGG